ncbi:unnamed protein product [Menidia menidia]|uniref:(Atlantic silverside) hypothetical protein n=1 Tax=Menidia menidia TaxID=238744 RepID=A0A8S4AGQ7_9TELE|nr:unnamed protein product [Menidia menidia]
MTTLDDKLLGEKLQYYYSSSEDEGSEDEDGEPKTIREAGVGEPEVEFSADGSSVNTGRNGWMTEWVEGKYKQLEVEQKQEQKQEMEKLIKKLSMTCRSDLDLQKDQDKQRELQDKIKGKMTMQEYSMLQEQEDDEDFLRRYRSQRMEEMRRQLAGGGGGGGRRFQRVFELRGGQDFLEALDGEAAGTLVMVHIYEPEAAGCEAMRGSLLCLAREYPLVKFCSVRSAAISTSALFRASALPALLVYKAGELIGNFVRLTDQLGEDFFAVDLEALLQEYGLLPDKPPATRNGAIVQGANAVASDDDDSDLDID